MTVRELILVLDEFPSDALVVVHADGRALFDIEARAEEPGAPAEETDVVVLEASR